MQHEFTVKSNVVHHLNSHDFGETHQRTRLNGSKAHINFNDQKAISIKRTER